MPNLRGTTLSILQWSNFIPDADPFFKKQIEDGFMKETGAQVNIEFTDQNSIAPKISAAIQSGSGPDIIQFAHNWPNTYAEGLVDVSDVAEDVQKVTGSFFPGFAAYAKVDGKFLGIPHDFLGTAVHYRKSWFEEVGAKEFPKNFDEYLAVGKKLKEKGHPLGESLGQSIGDPVFFTYPVMWNQGGAEVDQSGKVAVNSPGTIQAVSTIKNAWQDAFDETGLAWDDSSNNRAFLAETIAATQNGASIWWVARNQKAAFFDDIGLALLPGGPKGNATMGQLWTLGIMKYSKNVDAAKAFIRWQMQDAQWMPLFDLMGSFICGIGEKQNAAARWDKFPPVTQVFKDAPKNFRGIGWPGPPNQKAGLTQAKYIIVNMFAKAVQGTSPEEAVAGAEREMKDIYG
ncbi:MAG: extracellular solute-binding protein [Chloroflexi bacterium]|nr:extracellular solute-binding protein [Chloroflexota bacterium]